MVSDASGYAERFHLYLLSDTNDAEFAAVEEALFSELIATLARSDRHQPTDGGRKTAVSRPAISGNSASAGEAATSSR